MPPGSPFDRPQVIADSGEFLGEVGGFFRFDGCRCSDHAPVVGPAVLPHVLVRIAVAALEVGGKLGEERDDRSPVEGACGNKSFNGVRKVLAMVFSGGPGDCDDGTEAGPPSIQFPTSLVPSRKTPPERTRGP